MQFKWGFQYGFYELFLTKTFIIELSGNADLMDYLFIKTFMTDMTHIIFKQGKTNKDTISNTSTLKILKMGSERNMWLEQLPLLSETVTDIW